jgi:hypothetical protein
VSYRFTEQRSPTSVEELTDVQREQLRIAWEYYSGDDEDPQKLVADNPGWFQQWTVERDGKPAFDYWHLPPDSGTLFYAGEAVPTGIRVIQFGWDVAEPDVEVRPGIDLDELARELDAAFRAAKGLPPRTDTD